VTRLKPSRLPPCHNGPVEIALVRKGVLSAMAAAREQARRRRSQTAEAEKAFESFLQNVAVPLTKQVATVLKSEGHTFTVFTPEGGLRLASDRGRDDYIEFALDAASDRPQVVGRISRTRGSRTLTDERPVKADTGPDGLTEQDVLTFLMDALQPWLEK
jgi:hypothetical protein